MKYDEINDKNNINKDTENIPERKITTKNKKKKRQKSQKIILLLLIIIITVIGIIAIKQNNTVKNYIEEKTNLVINNNNVTKRLKHEVIIKENVIYISMDDIKNFFDKYIKIEENINKVITTGDIVTAEIGFNKNEKIKINGVNTKEEAVAITENGITYLPLSKMTNIYNININYIKETNIITVDSIDRELKQATVTKKSIVREKRRNILSNALEKINSGDKVYIVGEDNKGWTKIRTEKGKLGYLKTENLSDYNVVQEAYSFYEQNKIEGKINMFWDYFSENSSAPDRTGQHIEGVNVVSPTFFYIDKNGKLQNNIGETGKKYIEWAKSENLQIWPRVANDLAGIEVTSKLLNDYSSRQKLISDLVNECMVYGFDGVNIDFEYMYQKDKDVFSRLLIEMVPVMKGAGNLTVSIDVTAPDGGANWSLCYDRNVLGDVADYLIFMAYDQHGSSSTTAGTTAGYNWVENNIKKFINNEEVSSQKIILGIPFYTRIWTESNGSVVSRTVDMKDINDYIPNGVKKEWNDTLKQYYIEYNSGNTIKKMWIEDIESIKAKCTLVNQYNLAGVASWEKDREDYNVWKIINETIN